MIKVEVQKKLGQLNISGRFELINGRILALFGPSGAGKTSLINMVAGLLKPDRGLIQSNSQILYSSEKKINLTPPKRRIGYIFQDSRLFPHLSVRQNLTYGFKLVAPENRYIEFDKVIGVLGIEHLLKRAPHHLSGGEKQRVAIGRALLTSPRLLLMDEPLSSIDQARKSEILELIAELPAQFKVPIIYVSHAHEELEILDAEVVGVENGQAPGHPDSKAGSCPERQ